MTLAWTCEPLSPLRPSGLLLTGRPTRPSGPLPGAASPLPSYPHGPPPSKLLSRGPPGRPGRCPGRPARCRPNRTARLRPGYCHVAHPAVRAAAVRPKRSPGRQGFCHAAATGSLQAEVSVPSGCPGGVEVGWRDEPGDAGAHLDAPVFLVDHVVVMGAEQGSVAGSGGSAAGPVGDVVGLAPGGRNGALREGAAPVPGRDGLADVGREDAGGAADVQDLALAAEDDGDDVGVAGDFADGGRGDGTGERQGSRCRVWFRCRAVRCWQGRLLRSRSSRAG